MQPYGGAGNVISKFDLLFSFAEVGDTLELYLEYDSDIYLASRAERIVSHLSQLLTILPVQRGTELDCAGLFARYRERQLLLHTFNDTAVPLPDNTVMDLFAEQAILTPDRCALVVGEDRFTYRDLYTQSRRLAAYLQQEAGVQAGDYVGVLQERSALSVISMIAVMEAGGVYVPIDKQLPASRIEYIMKASNMRVLLTDAPSSVRGGSCRNW